MERKTNWSHTKLSVYLFACMYFLVSPFIVHGQSGPSVFTSDIDNFWTAFDSIQTVKEKDKQIEIMKSLYTDKGTEGLKVFMVLRRFDAAKLVESIGKYPKFWYSIRSNTLEIKDKTAAFEAHIREFRSLYPELRPAKIYFTITAIRAAGTVKDSMALIGSEIAMGNKYTDVSEFPDKRLANFFQPQDSNNIIPVVIHEYVHTQQKGEAKILLERCIHEGACDFITEIVLKQLLSNSYLIYGRKNEEALKQEFKKEMMGEDFSNWLYNGSTTKTMGDLGYFMGYTICKSYYRHARNKRQAIREIIGLNFSDRTVVMQFLAKSKYY
ncbi:MAG TPA: DUF2268 domain-containing putative Zn-dependent protease [Chitinophaga sp.]|uniref:gliding motility protein GldB-related protein n=1 Tax=Chitinophaga sp. TaxID=1869181 RepID=UPI002C666385|nr:DUF2268 domain-containing putative Zn-dependent protease [Chitinophaga sp.]HVI47325.1 DUF2268 domain-containing putative Zn-dependent protease [Chitinophaga sp.]